MSEKERKGYGEMTNARVVCTECSGAPRKGSQAGKRHTRISFLNWVLKISRHLLVSERGVVKTVVTGMCGGFRNFILIKLAKLEMSRMRELFTMGGTRHLVQD